LEKKTTKKGKKEQYIRVFGLSNNLMLTYLKENRKKANLKKEEENISLKQKKKIKKTQANLLNKV
jgi:hypothetical protein